MFESTQGQGVSSLAFSTYSEYVVILAAGLLELSTKVQYIKGLDSCLILKFNKKNRL